MHLNLIERAAICFAALVAVCGLALFTAAEESEGPIIETSNAVITSNEGGRLRIRFAAEGQPAVLLKPPERRWDWRDTSKLMIPVENPGGEPVTLLLQIADEAGGSLSGKTSIAPGGTGDLALSIEAPLPRKMGMIAGPSVTAAGCEPHILPVTATEGSVDVSRVTSVRLAIARPTTPREMVVGRLRVEPPSKADENAYQGIVDGFGQFYQGDWPEKVRSTEMLRGKDAAGAARLAPTPAQPLERDRFGGLRAGHVFRATGFFRTERRDGRWWLVSPEGRGFFRSA